MRNRLTDMFYVHRMQKVRECKEKKRENGNWGKIAIAGKAGPT